MIIKIRFLQLKKPFDSKMTFITSNIVHFKNLVHLEWKSLWDYHINPFCVGQCSVKLFGPIFICSDFCRRRDSRYFSIFRYKWRRPLKKIILKNIIGLIWENHLDIFKSYDSSLFLFFQTKIFRVKSKISWPNEQKKKEFLREIKTM